MDALPLDPGDYTGSYKLVGGRMSLDFVNTVSWPDTERCHDWFDRGANVEAWLAAVGLPRVSVSEPDRLAIVNLRSVLDAVLRPFMHGRHPTRRAVQRFNGFLSDALSRRSVDPATLAWTWASPRQAIESFGPVVLDAAELLAAGNRARLRACPACDWLFEDQTRNGRRRWCDMADCGSRDKARRYYYRGK